MSQQSSNNDEASIADDGTFSPRAVVCPEGQVFFHASDMIHYLRLHGLDELATEVGLSVDFIRMDMELTAMGVAPEEG